MLKECREAGDAAAFRALAASPAASPIFAPALGATRGLAQRGLTPLEKRKLKQRSRNRRR